MADEPGVKEGQTDLNPGLKQDDENVTNEETKTDKKVALGESESLNNVSSFDARAQLAYLITLVESSHSETGKPNHKKVVNEVFETVTERFDTTVVKTIFPFKVKRI